MFISGVYLFFSHIFPPGLLYPSFFLLHSQYFSFSRFSFFVIFCQLPLYLAFSLSSLISFVSLSYFLLVSFILLLSSSLTNFEWIVRACTHTHTHTHARARTRVCVHARTLLWRICRFVHSIYLSIYHIHPLLPPPLFFRTFPLSILDFFFSFITIFPPLSLLYSFPHFFCIIGGAYNSLEGARGVIVIVVGNEHGDTSSNPGRGCLHFTLH